MLFDVNRLERFGYTNVSTFLQQDCIQVGCVPTAVVVVLWRGCLLTYGGGVSPEPPSRQTTPSALYHNPSLYLLYTRHSCGQNE